MLHSMSPPMLIPLIVSVSEDLFSCSCPGEVLEQPGMKSWTAASSRLLSQSKQYAPATNKTRKGKRHALNHIFVLGGGAALCGRVGVTLVANCHLHGKAEAFLVNSPGKRTQKHHSGLQGCRKVYSQRKDVSPDVCHGVPVLVVCCPDGYFISFRTDIDHGSTYIVAVVIKGLTDQTQELKNSWSSARKETNQMKG